MGRLPQRLPDQLPHQRAGHHQERPVRPQQRLLVHEKIARPPERWHLLIGDQFRRTRGPGALLLQIQRQDKRRLAVFL